MSVWCLWSYVKQLINHSCRSDPNTTGRLPGHHVNESICCVLTHEIRPNENASTSNTGQQRKSLLSFWCWFVFNAEWAVGGQIFFSSLRFFPPFPNALIISAGVMNWAWSCLFCKLLVFPHRLLLLCNLLSIAHHVSPTCADLLSAVCSVDSMSHPPPTLYIICTKTLQA